MAQANFTVGCFWGVETAFRKLSGVVSVWVGYSGGSTAEPT
ncbi:MAG: peptide-methionine (S)-S-oxide reductase [bacterium]